MRELDYVITNPLGVHARPAAQLAQTCVSFKSQVTLTCNGKTASAGNVLDILGLHAKNGDNIKVTVEGPDEDDALEAVDKVLHEKFEEHAAVSVLKIAFFGTKDYDRTFFDQLSQEVGENTYNCDIHYFAARLTDETVALAKGYDAVCIFVNDDCDGSIVRALKDNGVRLILLRCAGFNNVDLKAAKECGITVLRVPAYSPYAVAEHAMALIQAANRHIHKAYNKVRDNNFALSGLMGVDLHNKVAGIMGTGKIGQCMARICKGYGMTVIGWDAYPNQKLVDEGLLTYGTKEEVLSKADLISLHATLIMGEGGTYHLIDKAAIDLMKDDAMLVNTARGPLIDTEALIDALKAGKFHAVALDVYEGEDPNVYTDHSSDPLPHSVTARLTMFPNLILTSHQAFFTREAMQAIAVVTMENARNFNEGRDLGNAEVKYTG
jgi:D-lactate dehydrogenase